jgi:hypothetical protein
MSIPVEYFPVVDGSATSPGHNTLSSKGASPDGTLEVVATGLRRDG